MAGIINKPLALFRRPESPRPLHTRWGDVGISVPTEGSWNQYDNPHRSTEESQVYGPGFVPEHQSFDRTARINRTSNNNKNNCETEEEEYAKDERDRSPSTNSTSINRRNSLSLGSLRPGRLSVRLASRPKQLRGETRTERETQKRDSQRSEFAYKPIQQNYTAEITEAPKRSESPSFKYIPTSGRYLEDIPASSPGPRSQSVMSHRSSHSGRDSLTESLEERDRVFVRRGSHQEEDRRSLRSVMSDASDGSSSRRNYGLPPRRRTSPFVPADRRRASLLKPMTMAMVPDPEDLYE